MEPKNGKHSGVIRIEKTSNLSNCTAFVINKNAAVTAAHCFTDTNIKAILKGIVPEKPDYFEVYTSKGEKTFIIASSGSIFIDSDIALIKADFSKFNPVPVDIKGFNIRAGEKIYTCGFAGGFTPPVCNNGEFIRTSNFKGRTDSYVAKGMSGGPVLNKDFKVIGVNSATTHEGYTLFGILFGILRTE